MKENVINFTQRLIKHELITGSMYVFIGIIISSFLNFLLNLFLARNLIPSDYGIYASLLSLFALVGIPAQSLTTTIVRFVADYFAKNKIESAANLYIKMYKLIFFISLFILIFFFVFSIPIKSFLNIENYLYIVFIGIIAAFSYLGIINSAFLQGMFKFPYLSFSSVMGSLTRLIVGILLVFLGLRVFGALWAIFLAIIISFVLQFLPLRFLIRKKTSIKSKVYNKEIISYALPVSIAILSLSSFISIDVILVKHFFNPYAAGLYGGLSLLGKVIFYLTGPISSVMFPLLIKRHNLGQNFKNLFYLSIALVSLPSIAITTFYFMFPNFSINFFLAGKDYLEVSKYLGMFGILLTLFSILNVFVNFFLSLKKTIIAFFTLFAAFLQIILISYFHNNFYQVIIDSILSMSLLLIVFVAYFIKEFGNINKIKEIISVPNSSAV